MTPEPDGRARAVLPLLVGLCALASIGLPVLSLAPNRLVTGEGRGLLALWASAPPWAGLAAGAGLLAAAWPLGAGGGRRWAHRVLLLALPAWIAALLALAASVGAQADASSGGLARTALASGTWLGALAAGLGCAEALRRARASPARCRAYALLVLTLLGLWAGSGHLDGLSVMKEYTHRADDFWRGVREHLQIVAWTLISTGAIGVPLAVLLHRHPPWKRRVLEALALVQTLPSIALFGGLMALLAWLVQAVPLLGAWGLRGVGRTPAVIALTLYALLPLVGTLCAGLDQVSAGVRDAAAGMGLSRRQRLWQVELPLAMPVLIAGVTVTGVQAIGLAVVAALIGAGGLGALMFEGLFSSAVDLVVLAVLPLVAMAWAFEALGTMLAQPGSDAEQRA